VAAARRDGVANEGELIMIVGYTYLAALWCEDCIYNTAKRKACEAGSATMWGDCGGAEDVLDEWAGVIGLDRADESSFDSGDFPKVVTKRRAERDASEGADLRCRGCGCDVRNPLGL